MRCQRHSRAFVTSLIFLVGLTCNSCQDHLPVASPGQPILSECKIDLTSSAASCTLSKVRDERVLWDNAQSDVDQFVCADPTNDPFEAYAWLVPRHDKRKSGGIVTGLNPPASGKEFTFTVSGTACTGAPIPPTRTNPKIVIKP